MPVFLVWLKNRLISLALKLLAKFVKKESAKLKQNKESKEDAEALKKALESGDKDAIAKAGEQLLNSGKSN